MKGQPLFRIAANYCGFDMDNSSNKKGGIFLPEHGFDRYTIKCAVYNTCRAVKKKSIKSRPSLQLWGGGRFLVRIAAFRIPRWRCFLPLAQGDRLGRRGEAER